MNIKINGSAIFQRAEFFRQVGEKSFAILYFDDDYKSKPILFSEGDDKKFTIFGSLKKNKVTAKHSKNDTVTSREIPNLLPPDSKLTITAFQDAFSEFGIICKRDVGRGTIWWSELFNRWYSSNIDDRSPLLIRVELAIRTDDDKVVIGSFIDLTIDEITINDIPLTDIGPPVKLFQPIEKYHDVPENLHHFVKFQEKYSKLFLSDTKYHGVKLNNEVPGITINCIENPSEDRPSGSSVKLPLASFMIYKPPHVKPCFWISVVINMSLTMGMTPHEFYDHYKMSENDEKASLAVSLVSHLPQAMEYITDGLGGKADAKLIDMFGDALVVSCGDCEDLALAILQLYDAFMLFKPEMLLSLLSDSTTPSEESGTEYQRQKVEKETGMEIESLISLFSSMQNLLSYYIPLLVIEGVTAINAEEGSRADNSHDRVDGAHAAINFLPMHYFIECIARWDDTHPIVVDYYANPNYFRSGNIPQRENRIELSNNEIKKLPVLVAEGTGMIVPKSGIEPKAVSKIKDIIYMLDSAKPLKKILFYSPSNGCFYKSVVLALSPWFLIKDHIGSFKFFTKHVPQRGDKNDHHLTVGCRFGDMLEKSDRCMIVPTGGLNFKKSKENQVMREFTPTEIKMMFSVAKSRVPPPIIQCGEKTSLEYAASRGSTPFQFASIKLDMTPSYRIEQKLNSVMGLWATKINNKNRTINHQNRPGIGLKNLELPFFLVYQPQANFSQIKNFLEELHARMVIEHFRYFIMRHTDSHSTIVLVVTIKIK